MHRIKVLVIQPFDVLGSIQNRSLVVAQRLKDYNVETVFVSPRNGHSFTKEALRKGFKVYKTCSLRPVFLRDVRSLLHVIGFIKSFPKSLVETYKVIKKEQPDIVQVNGFVCIQEAMIVALTCRRKFIWNLIGTLYPRVVIVAFLPLIRLAFRRVFVSQKLIRYYFGKSNDKVIYEPVNTDKFNPNRVNVNKLEALRKALSIQSTPVVGFVGFISPVKGLEYLIKSIKQLVKEKNFKIKLVIVGGVPPFQAAYYLKLKNLVHELGLDEDVIFAGYVKHGKIPLILTLFDVFVLPSLQEGTPVCILEAMAMERPVIASDVGGVSELVMDGITGILVPPRDETQLAESIIHLVKNKELSRSMGRRGRSLVMEKFSEHRCVLAYYDLYKGLVLGNTQSQANM